ncbi:TolB family protein [Maribacter antarcticus]|uniref:TolB family protein n=1 Tax=Maribacter antarcticus TaxID=505250 RepID=UPI0006849345|nr:DPP IV N-terminal domain-containing protein [Maribacter antarcticus]
MYSKTLLISKAFTLALIGSLLVSCIDAKEEKQTTVIADVKTEITEIETASNSKILFTSTRDGNAEIYTMNIDGSDQKRITNNANYDGDATWSPDGEKIVFSSDRDGNPEIYIMDVDGSNIKRITDSEGEDNSPEWSPDGSMIAFNTSRFGNRSSEILRRNIEGGETWGLNPTRLTFAVETHSASANNFISWSPDGLQIAFESDRDRDDPEIYLINAVDGSNMQRLTFTRALDEVPSWSPDSKQILYSTDIVGEPHNGNYEIYIMNRDGSDKKRLTNSPNSDTNPSMSKDKKHIVFESYRGGHPELYRMNSNGSNVIKLTNYKGGQPNGEREFPNGNLDPVCSPF